MEMHYAYQYGQTTFKDVFFFPTPKVAPRKLTAAGERIVEAQAKGQFWASQRRQRESQEV